MGNYFTGRFLSAVDRHHWFNPANQKKALRLAKRIEKRLQGEPKAYRVEFYRFWAEMEKLRRKDVLGHLRSCCESCCCDCKLKTRR